MTPEGKLQLKFKTAVKKKGGYSGKLVSPAHRGRTDQFVWVPAKAFPIPTTVYTEIKDGNKPLSPLQEVFRKECLAFGMPWECIRFEEDITEFIKKYY